MGVTPCHGASLLEIFMMRNKSFIFTGLVHQLKVLLGVLLLKWWLHLS